MRWLVHGNLAPSVSEALRRHGHEAKTPPDAGIAPEAALLDLVKSAHKQQFDIVTADPDIARSVLDAKWAFDRSIVFLQLTGGEVEQDDAVNRLFARYKRLTPGRLYIVTETRVKIRQLPTRM